MAGINLTLVQYVTLNELPALVGSNEIAVLTALVAYFLGLSLGYLVSDRLSRAALLAIGIGTLLLHFSFPFLPRYIAGTFDRINLGGNILPFIFLLVLFGISPFYAVFLPRLVSQAQMSAGTSLAHLYATELAGSLVGLAAVVLLTPARMAWILALHVAGLVALLMLFAPERRRSLAAFGVLPLLYLVQSSSCDHSSLAYTYKYGRDFEDPKIVASEHSPYQRVDIVQEGNRPGARKSLYLNGNLLYGSKTLNQHNLLVSIMPNLVHGPQSANVLVVGGGSLDSARHLAGRVGRLRIVEIDEAVVRLTRRHIQEERGGFPENWELIIDDGKHYLGNYSGDPFTVIAVDIPVPTFLQTAMLHSERFFALARSRLAEGGIFSISLAGDFEPQDPLQANPFRVSRLSHRIMAGLLHAFSHVTVVQTKDGSFAWATEAPLDVTKESLDAQLESFMDGTRLRSSFGTPELSVLSEEEGRKRAQGFEGISEADMQVVLRLSVNKLYRRFYERD